MRVNSGNDLVCRAMGGDVAGFTGTATASSATSLTGTGTPFVASAHIGHMVVCTAPAGVYGVITANTTSVLTVDRWYAPGSPGGTAGTTPSATAEFVILPGNAPAWYMALTENSTAPAAGDTTLTGEITTAGGGLIRKLAAFAHTTGTSSYTLTGSFTANGSDVLPKTIAKMGTFQFLTAAGNALHQTLLNATATLSASGDPLTVTATVNV